MSDVEDGFDAEPPAIDPYETLDLDRDATADQIKIAYRKAALKNHPGKPTRRTHETTTELMMHLFLRQGL